MECPICGGEVVLPQRKYCSRGCKLKAKAEGERERRIYSAPLGPFLCVTCGAAVPPNSHGGPVKLYCSQLCRRRADYARNGKEREQRRSRDVGAYQRNRYQTDPEWRRRRMTDMSTRHHQKRARSVSGERFGLDDIFKRDNAKCHLCRKPVARHDASMDHIIPLSLGGEHSLVNVALAHQSCNSSKNNRPANEQLRLIG